MKQTNSILVFLVLVAVIFLGFIAGKVAEPHQAAPTYTPWPTYTPRPTYTPYPTITPMLKLEVPNSPFTPDYEKAILQDYPLVDGSTSTQPLESFIVCRFYFLYCPWELDSNSPERFIRFFTTSENRTNLRVVSEDLLPPIKHHGTHASYENLIEGTTDLILVARLPSSDELAEAKAKGVVLDAQPVAIDAFVMLAHGDNPISTISLNQIRDVYSGRIINWAQIGGLDHPINAYQREDNSGSQELLKALVMGDTPVVDAPDLIAPSMMGPFNAIKGVPDQGLHGDPYGIAYSVYYYAWFIMSPSPDIKILAVNGIRPTYETIANRTYPLTANVYVVIRAGEPANATSVILRDWLLSGGGQSAVNYSGYVPIH